MSQDSVTKAQIKEMQSAEANSLRERMCKEGVDKLIKEVQSISDADLVNAAQRHVKIKVKLF